MNRLAIAAGGVILIVLLVLGAFTAVQLISAQSLDADLALGTKVLENVFDDGSGNPVTVTTIIEPSPDLPDEGPEAAGIFLRQEGSGYHVGTGSISINVEVVNGERSVMADHSGPELEVVIGPNTLFYEDVTEVDFEPAESGERRLVQEIQSVDGFGELQEGASLTAWGEREGDRILAELVVFSEAR
jgi:hypothetical protein